MKSMTDLARSMESQSEGLVTEWVLNQKKDGSRSYLIKDGQLREQSSEFLALFRKALSEHSGDKADGANWQPVRSYLGEVSRTRASLGFSPSETATFIFSLKQPMFEFLQRSEDGQSASVWKIMTLLDSLGLYTTEVHQQAREEIILRQQQDMLELSTPVVQLWTGILALPMIGTLDSSRTQVVMETLLQRIVETGSEFAIIDITGVPTVDTLVAQHLLKTVTAARLMGAECIISGIRPQIAATIVHLGVDLGNIATKANLADAFRLALHKTGQTFVKAAPR